MTSNDTIALGELIRKRRRSINMSQIELAKHVEVKDSYIAKIEGGRNRGSYAVLARISMALELPFEQIRQAGKLDVLQLYGYNESLQPAIDQMFVQFHPKVKSQLIDIGKILEKYA